MSKKRKKRRNTVGTPQGDKLVLLAGLPRDTLHWVTNKLTGDTGLTAMRYVGAPAQVHDWRPLYRRKNLEELLKLIERAIIDKPPHRLIVLYVPSHDADDLISSLGYACFLAPLNPAGNNLSINSHSIEWRHQKTKVHSIIYRTLQDAIKATNILKAEITDRRTSVFSLPAFNFYYPDSHSTISHVYRDFVEQGFKMEDLKENLSTTRFTRDQLPARAFKGSQYSDQFFQDCQGRVFPIDLHHGPARHNGKEHPGNSLSLVLQQRYRFGVTVRDGNLHYDVQYEHPKTLQKERMNCAMDGEVLVTGSHANVGVNDVIWVPGGRKESTTES